MGSLTWAWEKSTEIGYLMSACGPRNGMVRHGHYEYEDLHFLSREVSWVVFFFFLATHISLADQARSDM